MPARGAPVGQGAFGFRATFILGADYGRTGKRRSVSHDITTQALRPIYLGLRRCATGRRSSITPGPATGSTSRSRGHPPENIYRPDGAVGRTPDILGPARARADPAWAPTRDG